MSVVLPEASLELELQKVVSYRVDGCKELYLEKQVLNCRTVSPGQSPEFWSFCLLVVVVVLGWKGVKGERMDLGWKA